MHLLVPSFVHVGYELPNLRALDSDLHIQPEGIWCYNQRSLEHYLFFYLVNWKCIQPKSGQHAYIEVQGTESEIIEIGRASPISWSLQKQSKDHLSIPRRERKIIREQIKSISHYLK